MDAVLLNTNVASLLHPRKRGSSLRALYEPHWQNRMVAVSFQTIAELYAWAELNSWGTATREALDEVIAKFLVIPYDLDLGRTWGKVQAECQRQGRRLDSGDTWILATAIQHSLPLLTHDKDFAGLSIRGLNVICHA